MATADTAAVAAGTVESEAMSRREVERSETSGFAERVSISNVLGLCDEK